MKTRMWIFLVLYTLATLWPTIASAQQVVFPPNQQETTGLSLTPPATDLSVVYLSNIFGTVDGVLSGTGSQLLGTMFRIFNGALLVIGGAVVLYTLFVSTIQTAHEGEVLGKNWSSLWIPLRLVVGVALLIPKATGYSFIQIIIMWIAVMGVGAADSVWNTALDYFTRGGVLMQQNTQLSNITGGTALLSGSANLLRSLTCMQMLQQQLRNYQQTQPTMPVVPNFYQDILANINSQVSSNSTSVTVPVPASNYMSTNGVCGTLSWSVPVVDTTGLTADAAQQIKQSRTVAVQSMLTQLYGAAQQIVNNALVNDPANNRFELGHILNPGGTPLTWGAGTQQKLTNPLLAGNTLSNAAAAYFGIMGPTLNYMQNAAKFQALITQWINKAKATGWILAGSYYMNVIQLGNSQMTITENRPPTFDVNALTTVATNIAGIFPPGKGYAQSVGDLVNGTQNYQVGASSAFITDAITYGNSLTYGQIPPIAPVATPAGGADSLSSIRDAILAPINGAFNNFANLQSAQANYQNPVLLLASFGASLVKLVVDIFIGIAGTVLILMGLAALAWGFTFTSVIIGVLLPLLALFSPVLLAMLVSGLIMSLYIPIIPFIIFTFGAIGWIIEVIIGMFGGPFAALIMLNPEGGMHIWGKAEPALAMAGNLILRPTLMIFGFLIGMMLSYVGLWILNVGFGAAYAGVTANLTSWEAQVFGFLGLIVIYMLSVMQVVQKSFGIIPIVADEPWKWVGNHMKDLGGGAEAEKEIAGGARTTAETGAKAVTSTPEALQGMSQGMEGVSKARAANKEEEPPSPDKLTSDSQTGRGTVRQPGSGPQMRGKPTNTGGGVVG